MRLSAYEQKLRDRWSGKPSHATLPKDPLVLMEYPEKDPEEILDVYRLETEIVVGSQLRTFGPFCAACYKPELEKVTWRYKRELRGAILEPHEDGIPIELCGTELVCGFFACDRSFLMWGPWKDTWLEMELAGFRIAHYQVKRKQLKIGGKQVVWHPDHATFVKTLEYDQLVDLCRQEY